MNIFNLHCDLDRISALKREVISRSQILFLFFSLFIIIIWLSDNIHVFSICEWDINVVIACKKRVIDTSFDIHCVFFQCSLWWFYVWDWLFLKSKSKSLWDKRNIVETRCILISIAICFSSLLSLRLVFSYRCHIERHSFRSRQQRDIVSMTFVFSMFLISRSRDRCIDESIYS